MEETPSRRKPTGATGPISLGPNGLVRKWVEFPETKEEIELFIAKGFCKAVTGSRPHIKRYGHFLDLKQQPENSIDFSVKTGVGDRWIELCEFAPLEEFGGSYNAVSHNWDVRQLLDLVLALIRKKVKKGYGENTILLIYKTHNTLFIPPPILRAARSELKSMKPNFESIYYISPHSEEEMSVWEIWPSGPGDHVPVFSDGNVFVGP
jgi:hypothetical protein